MTRTSARSSSLAPNSPRDNTTTTTITNTTDKTRNTITEDPDQKSGTDNEIYILSTGSSTKQTWMSIYLQYTFFEEISDPEFLIKRAVNKRTCETVSIKIIEKHKEDEDFLRQIRNEIEIMWHLEHAHILRLIEIHDEPENIFLVYEYFSGEKLHHRIIENGPFSEPVAAKIILQLLQGVKHMHEAGVCHRDLKPENILIDGDTVKISEFSLSRNYKTVMKTSCGTPEYVAPEILQGRQYTNSVDIWSIGVISYVLLCNFTPFYGNSDQEIFEKILRGSFEFPSPDWDKISENAKDFIFNILIIDYFSRPSATDCLDSPWIREQTRVMR